MIAAAACGTGNTPDSDPSSDEYNSPDSSMQAPAGIELTEPGTALSLKDSATVMWDAGAHTVSAITVTVTGIKTGKKADFRFFALDKDQQKATPYYVQLNVTNEGPAGLGGRVPPIQLTAADGATWQPTPIVGDLKQCQPTQLPDSFLAEDDTRMCLVYLVEPTTKPSDIALGGDDNQDRVHWAVPDDL